MFLGLAPLSHPTRLCKIELCILKNYLETVERVKKASLVAECFC